MSDRKREIAIENALRVANTLIQIGAIGDTAMEDLRARADASDIVGIIAAGILRAYPAMLEYEMRAPSPIAIVDAPTNGVVSRLAVETRAPFNRLRSGAPSNPAKCRCNPKLVKMGQCEKCYAR